MKRAGRIAAIVKILSDHPNRSFGLGYFCELFGAAKSSISEDISYAGEVVKELDLGMIRTLPGARGGVRFVPWITDAQCLRIQEDLCEALGSADRFVGGGFLYTSDIMYDPEHTADMGAVFARLFHDSGADCVATIETKGIPVAYMTARLLNLPLVVIRREAKISEGPTMSINYFSGSASRVQKMSMSKKSAVPGSKALIIDDFMRAGGSLKGIGELLAEFEIEVCGIGVAVAAVEPAEKKINNYTPLVYLGSLDENAKTIEVFPNNQLFE